MSRRRNAYLVGKGVRVAAWEGIKSPSAMTMLKINKP